MTSTYYSLLPAERTAAAADVCCFCLLLLLIVVVRCIIPVRSLYERANCPSSGTAAAVRTSISG